VSTWIAPPPAPLKEFVCPVCAKHGRRKVLVRAAAGSVVEAYCRHCRFRKVVLIC
jgi:hypothetical protein